MPSNNDTYGLFSQYGFDLDPDKLREEDLRRRQKQAFDLSQSDMYDNPTARGAAFAGGMLGATLQNRKFQPTNDQQSRINTAKAAQESFAKWQAQNPDADEWTTTTEYKRITAKEAYRNGLTDVASAILAELDASNQARKKQDAELESAGIRNRIGKATEQAVIDTTNWEAKKGKLVDEAYLVGERDPNKTVSGILQDDMSLLIADGKRIPAGSWHRARPLAPSQMGGGRGRRGEWTIPDTESSYNRNLLAATNKQMTDTLAVDDLFNEYGKNPAHFIGDAGRVQGFADRVVRFTENFADAIDPDQAGGEIRITSDGTNEGKTLYNLSSPSARARYAQENAKYLRSIMPATLAKNAEMQNRYRALIVELAYATARAQEPGAKALTEGDFQRAMDAIGANLNNPEALRKIVFSKAMRANAELEFRFSMYDDDTMRQMIPNPEALNTYKRNVGELRRRLSYDNASGAPTGTSYGRQLYPSDDELINRYK